MFNPISFLVSANNIENSCDVVGDEKMVSIIIEDDLAI